MKTLFKYTLGLSLMLNSISGFSQFLVGPGNLYGHTTNAMQKIGIGNFPVNGDVQAKLHVSQFRLNANAATNGLLFRTDGDQSVVNQWQLFTGTSATAQTERFRLFVPANEQSVWLKSMSAGLILADANHQISLAEIITMREQIAMLQRQLSNVQQQLNELKK